MLWGFPVVSENDGHDDDDADFDIPLRQGYPNGIVMTVIIVTENADIIASDGLLDILAAKVCWVW